MKLKTNSIIKALLALFVFCQSVVMIAQPPHRKLSYAAALCKSKKLQLDEKELEAALEHTNKEHGISELLGKLGNTNESTNNYLYIENDFDALVRIMNDDESLIRDATKRFIIQVNNMEIPLGEKVRVPIFGNSYTITISIPKGELGILASLGARIFKENMGFLKSILAKLGESLKYVFRYSCKLDKENINTSEDTLHRFSDLYMHQPAFKNNIDFVTIAREAKKIDYGWSHDLACIFHLPEIHL